MGNEASVDEGLDSAELHNYISREILLAPEVLEAILKDEAVRDKKRPKQSKRRSGIRFRDRAYAINEMDSMSDSHFTRMFRLNRIAFQYLLHLLDPLLSCKPSLHHQTYCNRGFVTPKTRLAVTLRWLAGGSYLDICFAFGISTGTFYQDGGILWGTIEAIHKVLKIGEAYISIS